MNKHFLSVFFSFLVLFCSSQMKVTESIQKNSKSYPDKNFFYTRVIDSRANKESIGTVYKSDRTNQYQAVFRKPLAQEFFVFLKDVYPNDKASHKILMQVNAFQLEHILSRKDSGVVKLDVDFYELRNDSVSFISNFRERLAETSEDVSLSHANRIKRIILHATADMEKQLNSAGGSSFKPISYLDHAETVSGTKTDSSAHTLSLHSKSYETTYDSQTSLTKEDSISQANHYPSFFFFLVGGQANLCPNTIIAGANVNCLFHLSKTSRYMLGPNVNYAAIVFQNKDVLPNNSTYQLGIYNIGLRLLRQIKKIAFFNCNAQFMAGKEKLSVSTPVFSYNAQTSVITQVSSGVSTTESNFFGFQLDLGAYIMPPRHSGLYCGIDLTIRTTNSTIFDNEAGIKFNAGLKF